VKALLFGFDQQVASALFAQKGWPRFSFDRCVGILDDDKKLIGAAMFQNWNTVNVDFSYYGNGTLTMGLARGLARYALEQFNCARATTLVSKKRKRHLKAVMKFGFSYEGTQRCYYGNVDCARNTAVRLVLFREQLEKLARINREEQAA
jgi:uncharacterized protein with von Willebrand factor type A (vWA) domain